MKEVVSSRFVVSLSILPKAAEVDLTPAVRLRY